MGGGSSGGEEEGVRGLSLGGQNPRGWCEEGTQRDPLFGVYRLSEVGEHLLLLGLFISFSFIRMYVASAER